MACGFSGSSDAEESACSVGDPGSFPGSEDPLEEGMPTHSSILAWRILMDRGDWRAQGCKESDMTERLIKNSWMEETRRRGSGSHALPKRATLHMLTNLVAPQISSFCVFMEALLHSHAWVLSCV